MTNYSIEILRKIISNSLPLITVLSDSSVHVGYLEQEGSKYTLKPLDINRGSCSFSRSAIKEIILFNGLIYPKTEDSLHKILDIIELNDLINKAGYEFI